jgi:S1-C subfamily serine protease
MRPSLFLSALLLGMILFEPSSLFAQPSILDQMLKTQDSVVTVTAENTNVFKSRPKIAGINPQTKKLVVLQEMPVATYERGGAGVVIHPSGVIVTNAHIIHKANQIKIVFPDGTKVRAELISFAHDLDFSLLKIDPPFPLQAVVLADSDQIHLGDEVMTIGNSAFLKQTISGGKIIGLGTHEGNKNDTARQTDLIQTTINLYQGDSGGPLLDRQGHLIGLMAAKETAADHSSFAIPSNIIARSLAEYLKTVIPAQKHRGTQTQN